MMKRQILLGALAWLIGLMPAVVLAAPKHDEVFGDWKTFCSKTAEGGETCQIFQNLSTNKEGKQSPLLYIVMGYLPEGEDPVARIRLPLGILLQSGIAIRVDEGKPWTFPFSHCDQTGCWIYIRLNDDQLSAMKAGNKAFVTFADLKRKPYSVPISLNGFAKAISSLK
jgi:invasion protein IalB